MTLVLYVDAYKNKLLSYLKPDEEYDLLNIWYDPTPPGVKRFEDLLNNTNLLLVDKAVLEFCQTWHGGGFEEYELIEPAIKKWLAQQAKVLAIINAFQPDRIIFPSVDHFLRGIIKSACAHHGIKYTMVNVGEIPAFPIVCLPSGFTPGQEEVNNQAIEETLGNGKKPILWFADSQTILDLPAVHASKSLQPIIALRNNFVDPEILGVMPCVQLPGTPSNESITKSLELFGKVLHTTDWSDSLSLLGVHLNEDFVWVLHALASSQLARYYEIEKWFTELHNKWNLKGVLVGQDQFFDERSIVMVAKKLGIKTFVHQHGWYGDWYPSVSPVISDYALAWGPRAKKNLENALGAKNAIDIGTTRLLEIKKAMKQVDRKVIKELLGIPLDKPVVVYAANSFVSFYAHSSPYEMNEMHKRILNDFKDKDDLCLLVRFHPYSAAFDPIDNRDRLYEATKGKLTFKDPGMNLYETLAIADLVVTHESTVIVEAMYCGIRVVELSVPGKARSFQFDASTIELNPTHLSPIYVVDNVWEACHDILLEPNKCRGILLYTEQNSKNFIKQAVSDESGKGLTNFLEGVL